MNTEKNPLMPLFKKIKQHADMMGTEKETLSRSRLVELVAVWVKKSDISTEDAYRMLINACVAKAKPSKGVIMEAEDMRRTHAPSTKILIMDEEDGVGTPRLTSLSIDEALCLLSQSKQSVVLDWSNPPVDKIEGLIKTAEAANANINFNGQRCVLKGHRNEVLSAHHVAGLTAQR